MHGSRGNGKGNDQVRVELTYAALNPHLKVMSPWKDPEFLDNFKGRTDLINYAKQKVIIKDSIEKPYGEDENLMHISHKAGKLEDLLCAPDESGSTGPFTEGCARRGDFASDPLQRWCSNQGRELERWNNEGRSTRIVRVFEPDRFEKRCGQS